MSSTYELVALEIAENNALFPANSYPDVVKYGTKIRTCEKFDTCTYKCLKMRIIESFTKMMELSELLFLRWHMPWGLTD